MFAIILTRLAVTAAVLAVLPIQPSWAQGTDATPPGASLAEAAKPESVVRALIDAGNRSDVEAWLALFDPGAMQFRKSDSDHRLADRPSTRVTDAATRSAYYREAFASPQKVRAEIVGLISLGEIVMARGIFHSPAGPLHTLTVYRVRDGRIHDIWDVEQISRPECLASGCPVVEPHK